MIDLQVHSFHFQLSSTTIVNDMVCVKCVVCSDRVCYHYQQSGHCPTSIVWPFWRFSLNYISRVVTKPLFIYINESLGINSCMLTSDAQASNTIQCATPKHRANTINHLNNSLFVQFPICNCQPMPLIPMSVCVCGATYQKNAIEMPSCLFDTFNWFWINILETFQRKRPKWKCADNGICCQSVTPQWGTIRSKGFLPFSRPYGFGRMALMNGYGQNRKGMKYRMRSECDKTLHGTGRTCPYIYLLVISMSIMIVNVNGAVLGIWYIGGSCTPCYMRATSRLLKWFAVLYFAFRWSAKPFAVLELGREWKRFFYTPIILNVKGVHNGMAPKNNDQNQLHASLTKNHLWGIPFEIKRLLARAMKTIGNVLMIKRIPAHHTETHTNKNSIS